MPLPTHIKALIATAWEDGYPLVLATAGPDGPNLGPKGSLIVYDDDHLAYWERTRGAQLDNLRREPHVCLLYANFKAQRDGVLEAGFLRFYGTAALHESGPVHDKIFSMLTSRERTHAGADKGIGVLIKLTKAADLRGKSLL